MKLCVGNLSLKINFVNCNTNRLSNFDVNLNKIW